MLTSVISASLGLIAGVVFIRHMTTELLVKLNVGDKRMLGVLAAMLLVAQLILWPGVLSLDDLNLLNALAEGRASDWSSFAYSVLQQALYFTTGSPFNIVFINIFLYLALFTQSFVIVRSNHAPRVISTALFFLALAPLTQTIVQYQNRDSTFTLLFLVSFLELVRREKDRIKWTHRNVTLVSICFGILASLRFDGLIPASAFLLYVAVSDFFTTSAKRIAFVTVSFVFCLFSVAPQFVNPRVTFRDLYETSLLVNPLSSILHKRGPTILTSEEYASIDRHFDLKLLVQLHNPQDIDAFHQGGVRSESTHADFLLFRRTAFDLILRFPGDWIESRLALAKTMLGFSDYRFAFDDRIRAFRPGLERGQLFFGYSFDLAPQNAIQKFYRDWLSSTSQRPSSVLGFVFNSCLLPLAALFWALFTWRTSIALALFSTAALLRLAVILAIAPASYFKYIGSVWLGGWLVLFFLLADSKFPKSFRYS